jgi:adenylate cyclase
MNLQQHSIICKGCWQNLHLPVVLRGPLAIPFRIVGLRPSRMNPNTCTFCELAFARIMKARNVTIDATVLFADLRGYTTASQSLASSEMTSTLDAFYDECAEAIWEHDGLLNKTIGDAIMAVFNFAPSPTALGRHRRLPSCGKTEPHRDPHRWLVAWHLVFSRRR